MKRSLATIFWFTALLVSRAADFATTYHFTPNLTQESNPIVMHLGGHWSALIMINLIICAFIGACAYAYNNAKPRCDLLSTAQSSLDFASLLLYGQVLSKRIFLMRRCLTLKFPPKGCRMAMVHLLGYTLPPLLTIGSLFAVFAWFATRQWNFQWFIEIHNRLGVWLLITPSIMLYCFLEFLYFSREYQRAINAN